MLAFNQGAQTAIAPRADSALVISIHGSTMASIVQGRFF
jgi:hypothetical protein